MLIAIPEVASLTGAWDGRTSFGDRVRIDIIGKRDGFRRIELMLLEEDEIGELRPAPRVELGVCVDLQCAQVTQYEHAVQFPRGFAATQWGALSEPPRVVTALAANFLEYLADATVLLAGS